MRKKFITKLALLFSMVFLVTMVIAACGGNSTKTDSGNVNEATGESNETNSTENNSSEKQKSLILAYANDAETLDHLKTGWYSDALVYMFDRLVTRDYDFSYKPGLAERWEVSEDGKTWTFYLQKGVKFHDGEPLTANDVKWTLDTILDPETASPAASDFKAIKEVIVKDDHTVDIVLEHPFPNFLFVISNTAGGIASQKAYEKYGDEYGSKYVIGTGPYMFKEWIKGDKTVLVKNPDYNWGPDWMENNGKPILDEIVLKVLPEENSRLMEIESGNVHVIRDVTATMLTKLNESDNVDVISGDSARLGYLAYATDKEPFNDVRVRRAINYAINKEEIVKYVFRDTAKVAHGYLPQMLSDEYYEGSEKDDYKHNIEKAKQLLKEAGYENGLKLDFAAENSTEFKRVAEVIQSQLKEVGIEADIQLYDSTSYAAMLKEGKQELFLRLYGWPNADILDWFLLSSQMPYPNHSRWNDSKTDEMILNAASMPTWEERAEGYKEVQKYLIEQAVWVPIWYPNANIGVSKEVKNFKYHPWLPQYQDGVDIE